MGLLVEVCALAWAIVGIEVAYLMYLLIKDLHGECDCCATGSKD